MRRRRQSSPVEPCDVLVVCTGNICRSTMAAAMLAQGLPRLTIASAGTRAVVGDPPHPNTRFVLEEKGVAVLEHRARQLTREIAGSAGLIITMTRDHRSWIVERTGAEAFTVHELSRLLVEGDHGSAAELSALASTRLRAERVDHDDPEVSDPIGLPLEAYERCFADLAQGLGPLVRALKAG